MENHGQKRSACEQLDLLEGVKTIVMNTENTLTPTKFFKDTLFAHFKENVKTYLEGEWENEECQQAVDALREQAAKDVANGVEGTVEIPGKDQNQDAIIAAVVASVSQQTDQDKASLVLKQIQGHVYREAFKTGNLQSQLYDDVSPALNSLTGAEKKVYIYCPESTETEKVILGYSNRGDLQEKISGYFDLEVGCTTEKDSYASIAKQLEANAEEVLFVTGKPAEATAAAEAGFKTCIIARDENTSLTDDDKKKFNVVSSLRELVGAEGAPAKKQEGETAEKGETEQQQGEQQQDQPEEGEEKEEEGGDDDEEEEEEEGEGGDS